MIAPRSYVFSLSNLRILIEKVSEMCENSNKINYFEDVLPAEVKQIIFDNLSVSDLLNLCLVCQTFEDFIGKSHKCMEKIWIKFYSFKLKDLGSLETSSRRFEKLKVNRVKETSHFSYLVNLRQNWKKVLLYNCEFKQAQSYIHFVEAISGSIEELEISDIEILNNEFEIAQLKFPCLKRIMLRNVPSTAIEPFLGFDKKRLENASLDIVQAVEGKMPLSELSFKFLETSGKLNHLQLGPHYIKALFDQEDVDVKFSFTLKKILLKFPLIRDSSPHVAANVSKFLKLQPKFDWILFFEIQSDLVLTTAWSQKALKHITFIGLEELFDDSMDISIEPNANIIHLDLLCRKILISQLRKLLKSAPNLRVLHVHTLTRYVMEFTVKNHQMLEEIRYENIDEETPDLYNQLRSSSDGINTSVNFKKATFWFEASNPFSIDPNFWHT